MGEYLDSRQEEDQSLSLRECRKGLDRLKQWNIGEEELEQKFAGKEAWRPVIKFADFAKWCIEERFTKLKLQVDLDTSDDEVQIEKIVYDTKTAANIKADDREQALSTVMSRKQVEDIFRTWDADHSGVITEQQFLDVFLDLNPALPSDGIKTLFHSADVNNDGSIDYEEFCIWLLG